MRYFKARAQRAADEGDDEAELRCLVLARALCDDQDHELLYDQAVAAHERHELPQALALYERARALEWRDPRVHTNFAVVRQQLGMAPETASAMVPGHATASASGHVVPTRSAQTMRSETTRDGAPEAATSGIAPLERQAARLENGLHGESTRDGAPDAAAPLQRLEKLEERLGPTSGTLIGTLEAGARPRAQGLYL